MGFFPEYTNTYGESLGPKVKIHLSVYSSEFARFPKERIPEPDKYHSIDFFEPNYPVDEADDDLNNRAMQIFLDEPLVCESAQ
jgi:hypothetical protein